MADPGTMAIKVGLMAVSMALTMTQKIKGPRLDSLKVTLADYGTPITRFWGIRRLEGVPIFWAEDLREQKVTTKTKGGKYQNYKYYGTWAVMLADHDIEAVSRIWFDKHLVYDMTGKGPVVPVLGGGVFHQKPVLGGKHFRAYYGTEAQEPDPRMEAWCEDRYGVGTCPAYRGCSYLVFEDIALEGFGNRLPQVTVEVIRSKTPAYPYDQDSSTQQPVTAPFVFDPAGQFMAYWTVGGLIEWWDVPSHTRLGYSPSAHAMTGGIPNISLAYDGTAYFAGPKLPSADVYLFVCSPMGVPAAYITDSPTILLECTRALQDLRASAIVSQIVAETGKVPSNINTQFRVLTAYESHTGYLEFQTHRTHVQSARDFCSDADGNSWALFQPSGTSDAFTLEKLNLPGEINPTYTFSTGVSRSGPTSARFCHVSLYSHFFVVCDDVFYVIDDTTFTVTASGAVPWSTSITPKLPQQDPDRISFWIDFSEYSLKDGTLLRTVDSTDWITTSIGNTGYDGVSNAIWSRPNPSGQPTITIRYIDRVGSAGTLLSAIVEEVSGWAGIADADASALDQVVQGYSVVQGSAKDWLSPLLDIHDSDPRPHDFTAQFIKRGATASETLAVADFVRSGDEPRYAVSIAQDTDLPHEVTINFADVGKNQQANNVVSRRPLDAMDSKRKETIDASTYVSDPDEMQRLGDRRFRRGWNERASIKLGLTAQELALEPGDVKALQLDGVTWTARCTKVTLAGGAMQTEWLRDFPGLATLGTAVGAPMDARDPEAIYVPGATKGFVVDVPLIQDSDENSSPLLYYAAGGFGTAWPGAVVWQGDGTTFADDWATVDSSGEAVWGYATGALGDVASPWLWDRGNSINVTVFGGTLTSCTEAEVDADPARNLAWLAGELLNFTTATLETDGSYTLSGFKRGRRGTEWACGDHAAGDGFVLAASLADQPMGASDIGDTLHFKAQTLGLDPATAPAIDLTFAGNSLKPYAPAAVKATFDGTDWTFTVTRRTRYGGSWNGSAIALGEASEAYAIEVYSGATLKRTLSLSGTNSVVWTNAMQVSDFGSTQTSKPTLTAYQLSATVGRGFALAA